MIIDKNFSPIMEQVFSGRRLNREEVSALVDSMIDGAMSDVRVAAVLTGLRFLPVTQDMMLGAIDSISKRSPKQTYPKLRHLVDCSGTGGDGQSTVNISTMAGVVAASCGAQVAKFGSRSVTSKCGSADVLEALGVRLAQSQREVQQDLEAQGISFLYSPAFYPSLRHISAVRKSLGFHTIFDLLVPLSNPLQLVGQLIGVYSKDLQVLVAKCLSELRRERALVVHSDEGLDEISVCGPTRVIKVVGQMQSAEIWSPSDFGLKTAAIGDLRGGGADENARVFEDVLSGKMTGPVGDAITMNAAAVLWCAGLASTVGEGFEQAKAALSNGKAIAKLREWRQANKAEAEEE